jgi:hypothetical protein
MRMAQDDARPLPIQRQKHNSRDGPRRPLRRPRVPRRFAAPYAPRPWKPGWDKLCPGKTLQKCVAPGQEQERNRLTRKEMGWAAPMTITFIFKMGCASPRPRESTAKVHRMPGKLNFPPSHPFGVGILSSPPPRHPSCLPSSRCGATIH